MGTFLFYDLETSGLNKSFDQIMQFAAVRTDEKLNELERHSFYVKLRPDVIPGPYASVTHRISIKDTFDGLNEYEAAKKIHSLFNTPGTISLGYNTLGFDDEFLRFTFYRNLLTPYTHQFSNNCSRMDLFPIAVMYSLYKREILKWPVIDGKTSLKLEKINDINSFVHGQAHDATVDVDITIELARRLMAQRDMWDYLLGFFNKNEDIKRTNQMPELFQSEAGIHRLALISKASIGSERNFQAPALLLGNSIAYKNQFLWLRLDLPELSEAAKTDFENNCFVMRKKMGEPEFLLPPKDRFMRMIDPERIKIMENNIDFLKKNPDIFKEITRHYRNFKYEKIPDLDIDSALYQNGFMDDDEVKICESFHRLSAEDKSDAVGMFRTKANRELAERIILRNYPELSKNPDYVKNYMDKINPKGDTAPIVDFTGKPRTTPQKVLDEIKEIRKSSENLDTQQISLVDELESYVKKNAEL